MAPFKKITCIPTLFTCFNTKDIMPSEPKNQTTKQLSPQRLSLSDISDDPGSPLSCLSDLSSSIIGSNLHIFSLTELKSTTQDLSSSSYLGEGGFGTVHKGFIDDKLRPGLEAQFVAVKTLNLDGSQGHREWLAEVIFLGQLRHANLVKLIGYCCEDEHRLLVYEYMARGSLERQLFRKYSAPLPWLTRIKIAIGAAKGLAFLHEEQKPVIYRDFKASNVLLDSDYNAKLSDFGLAMDGPEGDKTHITARIMGTHGYAAPEYIITGHLTALSDVYSYGVVLLELITGRRAVDKNRSSREQNLVDWARPLLKDTKKLDGIMDPKLEGQYSIEGAKKVAALAYRCLSFNPKPRPTMSNVVKTLEPLMDLDDIPVGPFVYIVPNKEEDEKKKKNEVTKNVKISEEREMGKGENRQHQHQNGHKRRHRKKALRSRAVYSDTALYRTVGGTSLYSPKHKHDLSKGVLN